jgi:hypothetical protein
LANVFGVLGHDIILRPVAPAVILAQSDTKRDGPERSRYRQTCADQSGVALDALVGPVAIAPMRAWHEISPGVSNGRAESPGGMSLRRHVHS